MRCNVVVNAVQKERFLGAFKNISTELRISEIGRLSVPNR